MYRQMYTFHNFIMVMDNVSRVLIDLNEVIIDLI